MSSDWGPFPRLAAGVAAWGGQSGPWHWYARSVLGWVAPAAAKRSRWSRGRGWRFRQPASSSQPPPRQPRELANLLRECHYWLAARSLAWAAAWIAPRWRDLPIPLFNVTEKGVIWTLAACLLDREGSDALHLLDDKVLAPEESTTAGDFLALHLSLETLVAANRNAGFPQHRRVGGFRGAAFLANYPIIAGGDPADVRSKALSKLLQNSPITCLVYADVVPQHSGFLPCLAQLFQPAPAPGDPGSNDWRDLWISGLARSLLGALLSPAAVTEELQMAEQELARIEARVRQRWAAKQRTSPATALDTDPEVRAGRTKCELLRGRVLVQHVDRVVSLAGILTASEYFRWRFFDLLTRHSVMRARGSLRDDWKLVSRKIPRPPVSEILLPDGNNGYRKFRELLLGPLALEPAPQLSDQDARRLRDALRTIAGFAPDSKPEGDLLASAAGVSLAPVDQLIRRFWGQRIRLPFPAPDHLGPEPVVILTEWLTSIRNHPQAGAR